MRKTLTFLLVFVVVGLTGCRSIEVNNTVQSVSISSYENMLIASVKVYSNEVSAKTNQPLQVKLKNWAQYSKNELKQYADYSQLNVLHSIDEGPDKTLLANLDVNVQYGNRALREVVGFGAGRGGVNSRLTLVDSKSAEVVYQVSAVSELVQGGGAIDELLKDNLLQLLESYKNYTESL